MKHLILIFMVVGFIVLHSSSIYATNFWQAASFGPGFGAAIGGSDGKLYFTNGVSFYRSTDNGSSWDSLLTLPTGITFNGFAVGSGGTLFIATNGAGMIRSTDSGVSWIPVNSGFSGSEARWPTVAPSGDVFMGSASYGVFRSTNNGDSWTQVNNGLNNYNIGSMTVNTAGVLFVGVKGSNGVFKSTDNGANWVQTSLTTSVRIYSLTVAPNGDIYAGSRYDPNAPNPDGLYRSTDAGETWNHIGPAGQSINTSSVIFSGGKMFAATDTNGVYMSANNGATWDSINSGLGSRRILVLTIHNGFLYAGTYAGVFRSVNSVTSVVEAIGGKTPVEFTLRQNYPNPFNPLTNIAFSLSRTSVVSLTVYSLLGEKVATLTERNELPAGNYQLVFDAYGLASGVYFSRLEVSTTTGREVYIETKPMLLAR